MATIQELISTVGTINNTNSKNLNFIDSCSWLEAKFTGSFANIIKPSDSTSFTLLPNGSHVSKGAVRYWGFNPEGGLAAVILAWSAPENGPDTENKIYVVGGSKVHVDSISWKEVEESLDKSKSSIGTSYGIEASIKLESPAKAVVVANLKFT